MHDSIVGYTFNAEQLCINCMHAPSVALFAEAGGKVESLSVETNLDAAALYSNINRLDEATFDSDDFPKVILEVQVDGCEHCSRCNEPLVGDCPITYPHNWSLGGRGLCQNGRCRTLGSGDFHNDGDCLWHPEHPDNPYQCPEWVERDWCDHVEHQRVICPEFAEDGSCIHSEHMMTAGL